MALSARTASREIGTALAVLAIYVLTLLLPLHQAAAQQRDFDALGYAWLANWSVCAQLAADENGDPSGATALNCPATGVGKYQLALPTPTAIALAPAIAAPLRHLPPAAHIDATPPDHVGQSRAPPVSA